MHTIYMTGINFRSAPLWLRTALALSEEEGAALRQALTKNGAAIECVIVSTCNRVELYFTAADRLAITAVQDALCAFKDLDVEAVRRFFYFYADLQAVRQLIRVTSGLDSMVQGESEILGQVKTAHRQAWSDGTAQTTLNILFRDAVTAAKKIKTQVTHPSAPVSVATLAAKRVLDFKKLPTVLLVGSSGQIGTSVLKNLCAAGRCKILAPLRTRRCASREEVLYQHPNLTYMSYDDRFRALEIVDVVVSATASPHYVFTSRDSLPHIDATKPYLFLDLAIPLDVDPSLAELENITLEDIDSFKKLSAHNNRLRRRQNKEAVSQIDHYVDVFAKKQIFMRNRSLIAQLDRRIEQVADRMSPTAVIHNLIFNVRENTAPETFEIFMNCLSPEIQQRYFPPPQDGPECPDPVAVATSTADLMSGE